MQAEPISISETGLAMMALSQGEHDADMLQALRNSSLSKRVNLPSNGGYARAIAPWRGQALPDRDTLTAVLNVAVRDEEGSPAYGLMQSHIDTLYAIDDAWFSGRIDLDYGDTLESQRAWRLRTVEVIAGMAWKTISWALFIYDPIRCQLLTVDCWHSKRLGIDAGTLRNKRNYERVEDRMYAEAYEMYPDWLPTIVEAMLWLNYRGQGTTNHAPIGCRD